MGNDPTDPDQVLYGMVIGTDCFTDELVVSVPFSDQSINLNALTVPMRDKGFVKQGKDDICLQTEKAHIVINSYMGWSLVLIS